MYNQHYNKEVHWTDRKIYWRKIDRRSKKDREERELRNTNPEVTTKPEKKTIAIASTTRLGDNTDRVDKRIDDRRRRIDRQQRDWPKERKRSKRTSSGDTIRSQTRPNRNHRLASLTGYPKTIDRRRESTSSNIDSKKGSIPNERSTGRGTRTKKWPWLKIERYVIDRRPRLDRLPTNTNKYKRRRLTASQEGTIEEKK